MNIIIHQSGSKNANKIEQNTMCRWHSLSKYTKTFCKRTVLVQLIVEDVVTCFLGHSVNNSQICYMQNVH